MLTISGDQFLWDGKPYRILSGAMHYFRVLPEYWRDRMDKMRLFGLNTLETYCPWNLHEPRAGEFNFEGILDLVRYVETAAEAGLKVIVRPGPYICSEWDFGGLPSWLLKDPLLKVRCSYPPYLKAVERYFDALIPRLTPLLASRGGPVIALQVENEYGSYGADHEYLRFLRDALHSRGVDGLLFTSDGPRDHCLQGGTLPDLLATVNFAFDAPAALAKLREYRPQGPLMVTEFWSGWFDHWGEPHHISADGGTSMDRSVDALDKLLGAGASVSFYMFHGGTNFGFMNGANLEMGMYQADVTSYDYDAPLSEAGDPSPRWSAYRDVLAKYVELPQGHIQPSVKGSFGDVILNESAGMFESLGELSREQTSLTPQPMESYDQDYGFILYRTRVSGPRPAAFLELYEMHDRALVFVDGRPHAVLERETHTDSCGLEVPPDGIRLDILVENMGRVNFGPGLIDRKGILGGVTLAGQFLTGWKVYPLPLSNLSAVKWAPFAGEPSAAPAFFRGRFDLEQPADTFLSLAGWKKGVAWINGFNLGRYWNRGPQQTLFVPAPLLRKGNNEVILFELHGGERPVVEFVDQPVLG